VPPPVIFRRPRSNRSLSGADAAGDPGHSRALSSLFEEHNRTLQSFLMARLGNEHEAREVAQEAYVRLLQLHQPGTVSFLRAYLFKTAANLAVDRIRQRANRERLDRSGPESELIDRVSPDRRLMAAEELGVLEQALQELPLQYRRAFVLHRFEDWSTAQIAKELEVQERMVRNYISRAAIYCKLRLDGVPPSEATARVKG
jgi:RNA polymerase sigma-70 factor (ECF subfamily)